MSARVAIHGFGRTGRQAFKAIWQHYRDQLEVAAIGIHDLEDATAAAHLLKYDSNYGRFGPEVHVRDHQLLVGDAVIPLVASETLSALPWAGLGIDIAIEATGTHASGGRAAGHLEAGANKVIISAPSEDADFTLIGGVNEGEYDAGSQHVISTGSDTTNALAPVLRALTDNFEVENALLTAVRAYTNAQKLIDSTDHDLRRARSAPTSIVPTDTRAAAAIGAILPEMAGRLSGFAVRVPVPCVSIIELTVQLGDSAEADAINAAFHRAVEGPLGRVMQVSDAPLVSTDFRGNRSSAVIDAPFTMTNGPLAKISAWYDNEWGYSNRVADTAVLLANGRAALNGTG